MQQYGESIYGTRGGPLGPQPWGVTTQKEKRVFLQLFKSHEANTILLPATKEKVKQITVLGTDQKVKYKQQKDGITITTEGVTIEGPDTVILVELK